MRRRRTGIMLMGLGLAAGAAWTIAETAHRPTATEIAQRACIAAIARGAHPAEDAGALAAQAADCTTDTL